MSALERLDAIDARTNGATPGPWAFAPDSNAESAIAMRFDEVGTLELLSGYGWDVDAEFIAHSRSDVPVMATALRAILALHVPHPFGYRAVCAVCRTASGGLVLFPCATVRIIETELAR